MTNETKWNLFIWGTFALGFFIREILAVFRQVPWDALSVIIWDLEKYWPVTFLVMFLCSWLLLHLVAHFIL